MKRIYRIFSVVKCIVENAGGIGWRCGSFVSLKIIILLIVIACKQSAIDDPHLVANVGTYKITDQDFRISYELKPRHSGTDNISKKKAHLKSMVEDRLLTIAGYEHNLGNNERLLALVKWYREQAIRQELYSEIVKNQVVIHEDELRAAFKLLNVRLYLRHIIFQTKVDALEAYERISMGQCDRS